MTRLESPDELDENDVLRRILAQHTLEDFARLPFEEKMSFFTTDGTSSHELLDLFVESGLEAYLKEFPKEDEPIQSLEKKLTERAEQIVKEGAPGISATIKLTQIAIAPITKVSGETGARDVLALDLAKHLLVFALQENPSIGRPLLILPTQPERQFGYSGRRGSVVNSYLAHAGNHAVEDYQAVLKMIALIALIRRVVRLTTQSNRFWLYEADSKMFAKELRLS